MTMTRGFKRVFPAVVIGLATIGTFVLADAPANRSVNGTIWVANRGLTTPAVPTSIRGFDADTGAVVNTIQMTANSQAGDLAYAKGKLYVAEEMGSVPAIAVVDAETGLVITTSTRAPAGTSSRWDSTEPPRWRSSTLATTV